MKKLLIACVLVVLISLIAHPTYAETIFNPLNGGNSIETGTVDQPVWMENGKKELFLLYLKNGNLVVKKSSDAGLKFTNYSIPNLNPSLGNFRNLTLYNRYYQDNIGFFIATENGNEGIYALEFDNNGELSLLNYRQLDDPAMLGRIDKYEVHPDRKGDFYLTFLKNNRFGYRLIQQNKTLNPCVSISTPSDPIINYLFKERIIADRLIHYGIYEVVNGFEKRLIYFEISDGIITYYPNILSCSSNDQLTYELLKGPRNDTYFIYNLNGNLYTKSMEFGFWSIQNYGSPLNALQGNVVSFYPVIHEKGLEIIYSVVKDGFKSLYTLGFNETGLAVLHNNGKPLNSFPIIGEYKLLNYGADAYLLGFYQESEGQGGLKIFNDCKPNQNWVDISEPFSSVKGVVDFSFQTLTNGAISVVILANPDLEYCQNLYIMSTNLQVNCLGSEIVNILPEEINQRGFIGDTFYFKELGKSRFFNCINHQTGILEGDGLEVETLDHLSLILNVDDGFIKLMRLPAPVDDSNGALWSVGSTYNTHIGLCRVYFWKDRTPGEYSIEVERYGFQTLVTWGGIDISDSGEEKRFFNFLPGDSKSFGIEVWDQEVRKGVFAVTESEWLDNQAFMEGIATLDSDQTSLNDDEWVNAASVRVFAAATDNLSGVDASSWQYNINGGIWQPGSSVNITSTGETKVFFKVKDLIGNESIITSTTVKIDRTPPVITATGSNGWVNAPSVTASATAIDSLSGINMGTWEYKINDGAWNSGSSATISTEGTTIVTFRVRDNAGNLSNETNAIVRIDRTPPVIIANGSNGWVNAASVEASATATDSLSGVNSGTWEYKINNGVWTSGSSAAITAEGTTKVSFRVRDNTGNWSSETSATVEIDRTLPIVTATGSDGWVNAASVTASATATDSLSGVDSGTWEYKIDSGVWTSGSSVAIIIEGTTTVTFRVSDNAGNLSSETSATVNIDRTLPIITATGSNGWVNATSITASATATDSLSGVNSGTWEYKIGTGIWSSGFSVAVTTEGITTVTFRIRDNAGNLSGETSTTVKIDRSGPMIIATGSDGWVNLPSVTTGASATDTFSGIDAESWQYKIGAGVWRSGSTVVISNPGETTVYFKVKDFAGNETTAATTIKIDRIAPGVDVAMNPASVRDGVWTNQSTVSVFAIITDIDNSGLIQQYSFNNNEWLTYDGGPVTIRNQGITQLWFRGIDGAQNITTRSVTIKLDQTLPKVQAGINTPGVTGDVWTSAGQVLVSALISDTGGSGLATQQYRFNDGEWTSYQGGNITITREGITRIEFRAVDGAGNISIESINLKIDRTGPAVNMIFSPPGVISGDWTSQCPVLVSAHGSDTGSGVDQSSWEYCDNYGPPYGTWNSGSQYIMNVAGARTVYFRVKDNLGNLSQPVGCVIKIDDSGPMITAVLENQSNNNTLRFKILSASDLSSGMPETASFKYRFNVNQPWADCQSGQLIPIPDSLPEGETELQVMTEDQVGNSTTINVPFIIDRTNPNINGLMVKVKDDSDSPVLAETDFSASTSVFLLITATDFYNIDQPGVIAGFRYIVSNSWTATPDFSPAALQTSNSFGISGLQNGINYLYLKAVDAAGNESAVSTRIIRVDDSYPGKPVLLSVSHPAAVTTRDAVAVKDALFLISPARTGDSGMKAYRYQLQKGSSTFAEGFLTTTSKLEFTNLPDNQENEFYNLAVWSVGGNGHESLESSNFTFRIDTTPPRLLKITSSTHANPDTWYASNMAMINWNQPLDFTGVKSYYYKISATEITGQDIRNWTSTSSQSLALNLKTGASPALNSGEIYLAVCAEDFAGNMQFDRMKLKYDTELPKLNNLAYYPPEPVTIATDTTAREATLTWGEPYDNVGVSRIELQMVKLGESMKANNWMVKDNVGGTEVWAGLEPDITYIVYLKVVDLAQNEKYYFKAFTLNGVVNIEIALPFVTNIHGYTVTGTTYSGPTPNEAYLELPATLDFRMINPDGTEQAVSRLALIENLQFDANQFRSGANPAKFKINLAGYELAGEGLTFSVENGLSFNQITYCPEFVPGVQPGFVYHDLTITPPPQLLFKNGLTNTTDPFELQTYINSTGSQREGFILRGITTTGFKLDSWILYNGKIDLSRIGGYTLLSGPPNSLINIKEVAVSPEGMIKSGILDQSFMIPIGGNRFEVINARLEADRIVVLKANLHFANGFTNEEITLENFSITIDGNIVKHQDFRNTAFSFVSEGIKHTVATIDFEGNNLVIRYGIIDYGPDDQLAINGMLLKYEGVSYELPARIPNFSQVLYGFTVWSNSGIVRNDGLYFETATVELPSILGGSRQIQGLLLSKTDHQTVLATGIGREPFDLDLAGYGATVKIKEVTLNGQGIFASKLSLTLPEWAGSLNADFYNLALTRNGLGVSDKCDFSFAIAGFGINAKGAVFNGSEVSFDSLELALPPGYSPSKIELTGLRFNWIHLIAPGLFNKPITLTKDGWMFELSQVTLDQTGITCRAELRVAKNHLSGNIVYPNFRILADGRIMPGEASGAFNLILHGWNIQATDLVLNSNTLRFNGRLSNPVLNGVTVDIPEVVVDSDGRVTSSGVTIKGVEFTAHNGFRVKTESFTFTGEGLFISAKVYFPQALGADIGLDVVDLAVKFDADGTVTTAELAGPVVFSFGGFDLTAKNIKFDNGGLHIGTATISIFDPAVDIDIPNITFKSDGTVESGKIVITGIPEIERFGWRIKMDELSITAGKVSCQGKIRLPDSLGGREIEFDNLSLLAQAPYIKTDTALSNYEFNIGNTHLKLSNLTFSKDELTVEKAIITLPPSLESVQLTLSNFSIDKSGNFYLKGLELSPFQLWGYTFKINNIQIAANILSLQGTLILAQNFIIPELAGRPVAINSCQFNADGTVTQFKAVIDAQMEFNISKALKTSVGTIEIGPDGLVIKNGKLALTVDFPGELKGIELKIHTLEINSNGKIKNIQTSTSYIGQADISLFGGVKIRDTVLGIHKTTIDEPLDLKAEGILVMPPAAPGCLANAELKIITLTFDENGKLKESSAVLNLPGERPFIGGTKIKDACINAYFVNESIGFDITGTLIFPPSAIGCLAGAELPVTMLKVNSDGKITELKAELLMPGSRPFIGGMTIKDGKVNIDNLGSGEVEYTITGTLIFPPSAIGCLAGAELPITTLKVDTDGKIQELNAELLMPGVKPFIAGMTLRDGKVKIDIQGGAPIEYNITGTLIFPTNATGCLANAELPISTLKVDSDGKIKELKAELSMPGVRPFIAGMTLRDGKVKIDIQGGAPVEYNITGTLIFPPTATGCLANAELPITTLKVDSDGKIQELDAELSMPGVRPFIAGMTLRDGKVKIDIQGGAPVEYNITGTLIFPPTATGCLAGAELPITTMKVDSDGKIQELKAELLMPGVRPFIAGMTLRDGKVKIDIQGGAPVNYNITGTLIFPPNAIGCLANAELPITTLKVDSDGKITELKAELLMPGSRRFISGMMLQDGKVKIDISEGAPVNYDITGTLIFPSGAIGCLAGAELPITTLKVDSDGKITELKAELLMPGSRPFIGGMTVRDGKVNIDHRGKGEVEYTITGTLIFPFGAIGCLAGAELPITTLKVDSDGKIQELNAELLMPGARPFIAGMTLRDGKVEIDIQEGAPVKYNITGTLIFPPTATGCLAGAKLPITTLKVDSDGKIQELNAELLMPGARPFIAGMTLRDGKVKIDIQGGAPVNYNITGTLIFPPTATGCLAGAELPITTMKVDSDGKIQELNAELLMPGARPFIAGMTLRDGKVKIDIQGGAPVNYNITGTLIFPPNATGCLANAELPITTLKVDSDGKITELKAELLMPGSRPFISGMTLRDGKVKIDIQGDAPVNYSITGTLIFPPGGCLANAELPITILKVDSDGKITALKAELLIPSSRPFIGGMTLRDGKVTIDIPEGGVVDYNVMGTLIFPPGGCLANAELPITTLRVDSDGKIKEFKAELLMPGSRPFISKMTLRDGKVKIDIPEGSAVLYDLSGTLIFPPGATGCLANAELPITTLKVDSDGKIKEFIAELQMPGNRPFIGDVTLKDGLIRINSTGEPTIFDIGGTLILPKNAPGALSSAEMRITALKVDSDGNLLKMNSSLVFSEVVPLFLGLSLKNGSINIDINKGDPVAFSVGGSLILPDHFPEGLRGMLVKINSLTLNSIGEITWFDGGLSGINISLFGKVRLENGTITGSRGTVKDEYIFSVTGDLVLPNNLPGGLGGMRIKIQKLVLSNKTGLVEFKAGSNTNLEFEIFAGIRVKFTSMNVGNDGFSLTGDLSFPASFPGGLAGRVITLNRFEMLWDGTLKNIDAGIGNVTISLGGFTVEATNLAVSTNKITMGTCALILPANLEHRRVNFRNAGFDENGRFYGEIMVPDQSFNLAGFTLKLFGIGLDISINQVSINQAVIVLPDFMHSKEITLSGVKILPSGITFTGGGFGLPNFHVGILEFRNVQVNFYGDKIYLAGNGKAVIPGAGTFNSSVKFTQKSSTYPLGIEYAEFSYRISGMGLPMGFTGLFINEISGGLYYGYPYDVPAKFRSMFGSGSRIRLGATMEDATGGSIFSGRVTNWIDINDSDWAIAGDDVSVLSGLVKGDTVAVFAGKDFYGSLSITFRFVRGTVEIYIFQLNGRTKINGAGRVQFGLAKGSLLCKHYKIWRWRINIDIPPSDWWLVSLGAEFGTFTNGKNGFKGYVNVPVFGTVGIFVGGGGLDIGNVDRYVLYMPYNQSVDAASKDYQYAGQSITNTDNQRVYTLEDRPDEKVTDIYRFMVPGKTDAQVISGTKDFSPMAGVNQMASDTTSNDESEEPVERIVFVLGYPEGDPVVTAISPSGRRYSLDDPEVIKEYNEWGLMIAVLNPEPGEWGLEIGNLIKDSYGVEVFGKTVVPEIKITSPTYSGEHVGKRFTVTGQVTNASPESRIAVYLSKEKDTYVGIEVAETGVDTSGNFQADIDTSILEDGEYHVFAGIKQSSDMPEVRAYAEGTVVVLHYGEPLKAITDFIVTDNEEQGIDISFKDGNGNRTYGFNLYIDNLTKNTQEKINLGYLTKTNIPGFDMGDILRINVVPYDQQKNEGERSITKTVTIGGAKQNVNYFTLNPSEINLSFKINEVYQGKIGLNIMNPIKTDSAYDFIDARVSEAPAGLSLSFTDQVADIMKPEPGLGYTLFAADQMAPGEYIVKVTVFNCGNREIKKELILKVSLTYPEITVSDLSHNEWSGLEEVNLEIQGTNFFNGTRLFLDNNELPLKELDNYFLRTLIPSGLRSGEHIIKVVGPGGDQVERKVNILCPDYLIIGYKTRANVMAGKTEEFYFTIEGIDGFSSPVRFNVRNIPANWNAILTQSHIYEGEMACLRVTVPENEALGDFGLEVVSERGDILPIQVTVTDTAPQPFISSLSTDAGFASDLITIFGSGFGTNGTVKLGDKNLTIIEYREDRIKVIIDGSAVGSDITVERDGIVSNWKTFFIKNRGFNIYPEREELKLQGGEFGQINLNIMGYEKKVDLLVATESSFVSATLTNQSVIPNGKTSLRIGVAGTIPNGKYPITVTGTSGDLTITKTINIIIGDAFMIFTDELPPAMENTIYRAELKTKNGSGYIRFSMIDGELPLGLSFNTDGIISGKPTEIGSFGFTVKAVDSENREVTKRFSICVAENCWPQSARDGGRTKHNPVKSPADARRLWISDYYPGAKELFTGRDMVYLLTETGVLGHHNKTGALVYRYNGIFTLYAYANDTLYLLDANHIFHAVDARFGNQKWQRENVTHFTTDGNTLVLAENNHISILEVASGSLTGTIEAGLSSTGIYLWQNGELFRAIGKQLAHLTKEGWVNVFNDENFDIKDVAADSQEIVLLLGNGRLVILDNQYQVRREALTGFITGEIALTEERIIIASDTMTASYDRTKLTKLYERFIPEVEIAAAAEKIFIANHEGLVCLNGYNGKTIWSQPGGQLDLAIAGENVYALASNGQVTCFNGPDNIYYPTTNIVITPGSPDGAHGFYKTTPLVELKADDKESYIAETKYRYQNLPWMTYNAPFELPDGEYSLITYSVDNHGYREPDLVRAFQVDSAKPTVEIELKGIKGENEYFISTTSFTLEAWDGMSGVDNIEYQINDSAWLKYETEVNLPGEGRYQVRFRAKDRAGNISDVQNITINIDLIDPTITAVSTIEPGLGVIYLSAEDSLSGVTRIEYKVDGGRIMTYLDPVALITVGEHLIEYQAIDNAGRSSGWKSLKIEVPKFTKGEWIQDLKFAYWLPHREVVRDVKAGERLYEPGMPNKPGIKVLPSYLKGADFIRTHISDKDFCGDNFITFTAGAEIDVYIMKHKQSNVKLTGWSLVERNFPVEPKFYFEGGADIYRKSFTAGERVIIPGSDAKKGWGNLYFVQYSVNNYLKIISPQSGQELVPLRTIRYAAALKSDGSFIMGKNPGYEWKVKYGNGDWIELGNQISGEITLPYLEINTQMQLQVTVTFKDQNLTLEQVKPYQIMNKSSFELLNPGPGTEVLANQQIPLIYRAFDLTGTEINPDQVEFYQSTDGISFTEIGNGAIYSDKVGTLFIKAVYPVAAQKLREKIFRLSLVERYQPVSIEFGKDTDGEFTKGEIISEHRSGRVYGFNKDHTDRMGRFKVVYSSGRFGRRQPGIAYETYIRFLKDVEFSYFTGNGRFKVTILVGPIERHDTFKLTIGGKKFVISSNHKSKMVSITTEIKIENGVLKIAGSEGLPIINLRIEQLEQRDPIISECMIPFDEAEALKEEED